LASMVPLSQALAASPTLTPATGGGAISADTTGSAIWTTLTGPVITENVAGGLGLGTIVLHAPAGFKFRATFGSAAKSGAGCNMILSGTTVTASTVTVSV